MEEKEIRRCSHCGKPMKEGYLWGEEYYCSDECLHACYTQKEIDQALYDLKDDESIEDFTEEQLEEKFDNQNDFFYTEWESIYLDDE